MSKITFLISIYFYLFLSKVLPFFLSKKKIPNSILYLPTFFSENAGYHWRVYKWAELLKKENYTVDILTATHKEEFYTLLEKDRSKFLTKYLHKRFWQVLKARNYETVIVRRELLLYNEYGNLFLEKLLLKMHPNTILDFDDDIAYSKKEPREVTSLYGKMSFENGSKFTESLQMYQQFFVGSNYLKKYVLNINPSANILVLPTCVDYEQYEPKKYNLPKEEIVFGWVGSNGNQFLIDSIIEPLNEIAKKHAISLLLISGKPYQNKKANFRINNIPWSLETEIEDIKKMDIGLMPLLNTNRDKGKAGFKLIQYMGLGVVSIASAVTVNKEIVKDDEDSYLVVNNEWLKTLKKAIENKQLEDIGKLAFLKIKTEYSFNANTNKLILFLKKLQ